MSTKIYTLHAVSKPKLVGTSLLFRSPSIVLGHPITCVFIFLSLWHVIEPQRNKYHKSPWSPLKHGSLKVDHYLLRQYENLKYSPRRHAFVLESSPPITTSPCKSSFIAVSSACLNCIWHNTYILQQCIFRKYQNSKYDGNMYS